MTKASFPEALTWATFGANEVHSLTLGSSAKTCEARGALLEDLRRDEAEFDVNGPVEVNGRRPDWIESLDTPLNNGDEVRWAPPAEIRPRQWPGEV